MEQASIAQNKLKADHLNDTVRQLFSSMDDDASGYASGEEFQACVGYKATRVFLNAMEIRPEDALTLFDMVDTDRSRRGNLHTGYESVH